MFSWKRIGCVLIVLVILTVAMAQVSFGQRAEELVAKDKTEDSAAKDKEAKGMTLWQVVLSGGWIMIVIGLCSVLAMWLIIEHFVHIRTKKLISDSFIKKIHEYVQHHQYNELYSFCKQSPGLISNMVAAALEKMHHGIEKIQEAVAESGEREESKLTRKISYLSIIATISPMLGLLGTVLGMIQAFNVIAFEAGLGKPTLLAAGVSKALVTTAAGLIVAIPAMAFYFFFRNRVHLIIEMAEDTMTKFIELLAGAISGNPPAETAVQEGEQK